MKTLPKFLRILRLLSLIVVFSPVSYAQSVGQPGVKPTITVVPQTEQKVILYDSPNFGEPSRSYGIGNHRLFDFNDVASSIKVPADLVVIVYEHSEDAGGYGSYVDFLEDQPDLAQYNLDNKISHLKIIKRKSTDSTWVRNRKRSGKFEEGHYEVGILAPADLRPLVAKKVRSGPEPEPQPRPKPPPPGFCTISGRVRDDKPSFETQITLYSNGSPTSFSMRATRGGYRFTNVPEGTYEVKGKGKNYPPNNDIFADDTQVTQVVTCRPNGSHTVMFKIGPTEG